MENFEQIVFYNQWHNGDVFSSKGYVNDIIQKLPQIKYYYAHECHPKVICDINADYIPVSALNFLPPSEETVKLLPDRVDEINKIEEFIPTVEKIFEESNSGGLITMEKAEIIKFRTSKK